MVSKALLSAAENLGLTYVEKSTAERNHMFGIYGGYLISLYDSGNNKTVFVNYHLPLNEDEDESVRLLELSEALKNAASGLSVTDYSVEQDGLLCTVNCQLDDFFAMLDRIIDMLSEENVNGVSNCSCCGNKIGKRFPKKLTVGKKNFLLCEHCALDKLESSSSDEKSSADTLPKKTGLGILGAVCGGLVGILLYFFIYFLISPLFFDSAFEVRYIFSLLGFATAALVYFGFKFFSKRPCVSAYISISAVTLVSVTIAQYVGTFVEYAKLQGFTLSQAIRLPSMWSIHLRSTLDTTLTYDQSVLDLYHVAPLFYKLLCFSLLFALIGSIIFQLGFYEKSKVRKTPIEVETLRISQQAQSAESET